MHYLLPLSLVIIWAGILHLLIRSRSTTPKYFISDYAAERSPQQKTYIVAILMGGLLYGFWTAWAAVQLDSVLLAGLGVGVVVTQCIGIIAPRLGRLIIVHDVVLFISAMTIAAVNVVIGLELMNVQVQRALVGSAALVVPAYFLTGYLLFVRQSTSTLILQIAVIASINSALLLANGYI